MSDSINISDIGTDEVLLCSLNGTPSREPSFSLVASTSLNKNGSFEHVNYSRGGLRAQ